MKKLNPILVVLTLAIYGGFASLAFSDDATTTSGNMDATSGTNAATQNLSDQAILKEIQFKIAQTKSVKDLNVRISVLDGVATLRGQLQTNGEADALVETVQSVRGVSDVNTSYLKVTESTHSFSDSMITAKIKGIYLREKLFGDKDVSIWDISVETKNGVVYLLGTADNKQQLENAIKLAQNVAGVIAVRSKVEVRPL